MSVVKIVNDLAINQPNMATRRRGRGGAEGGGEGELIPKDDRGLACKLPQKHRGRPFIFAEISILGVPRNGILNALLTWIRH